ncbi:hypothetical protein M513_12615 [Trichuris suis]|uniref:Uncharacterized protein n=1 Tax=Trichuris suis TaxID=68888 RepID=A0A085LNF5_9BILA|nr:hypothetical protein M513_12615 [Trichuris suis]
MDSAQHYAQLSWLEERELSVPSDSQSKAQVLGSESLESSGCLAAGLFWYRSLHALYFRADDNNAIHQQEQFVFKKNILLAHIKTRSERQ